MIEKLPQRIHIVGIGGAGMSAIARVLLEQGYSVSGSDIKESRYIENLREMGARIFIGHKAENIEDSKLVVYSTAIGKKNVEIVASQKNGIPVIHRSEMLYYLTGGKKTIAITGTHGKTTTTSLAAFLLSVAGLKPAFIIGGELNEIGTNAQYGEGQYFVIEADESDGSFLYLKPYISIITNLESEHLDYYGSFEKLSESFKEFIEKTGDTCIFCADDAKVLYFCEQATGGIKRLISYGFSPQALIRAEEYRCDNNGGEFLIYDGLRGKKIKLRTHLKGKHNIQNALSIYALGVVLSIKDKKILKAIEEFPGVRRRFELKGRVNDITVIDDYAHHPTEIRATVDAARSLHHSRLIVVFQPHRYSRVANLYREFLNAFEDADVIVATQIYGAGEEPFPGVSGQWLFEMVANKNIRKKLAYIPRLIEIPEYIRNIARSGDVVLFLGAGDITLVSSETVKTLESKS